MKNSHFILSSLLFCTASSVQASSFNSAPCIQLDNQAMKNDTQDCNLQKIWEKKLKAQWQSAFTELGIYLATGIGLYSLRTESMEEDWDYEVTDGYLKHSYDRFTSLDQWKLDDNDLVLNWGHVYAGSFYYQAFRNNNLSAYESILGPLTGSLIWEGLAEHREAVSINDHMTTIFAGSIVGEGFFQTAEMLKRKQGLLPKILSSLFNPSLAVHDWYNDKKWGTQYRNFNREFGFDNSGEDILTVYSGITYSDGTLYSAPRELLTLGIKTRTQNLPAKREKSKFYSFDPLITETQFELGISQDGNDGLFSDVKVVYGGYADYQYSRDKNNVITGHSLIIGPSAAVEFNSLGKYKNEDLYATINLIGGTIDYLYMQDKWILRGEIEAYGDFAFVKPFATNAFNEAGNLYWQSKPVLWKEKYSYALGFTTKIELSINYDDFTFGLSSNRHSWDSIDNKEYERVNDAENLRDIDFKDNRTIYKGYISYKFANNTSINLNYRHIKREGELIGIDRANIYFHSADSEKLWSVNMQYHY